MSLLQKTKEITSCALLKSNEIIINTQAPCFGFPSASSLASRLLLFSLVFGQTRFCGKGLKCWRVIFAIETCDGLDSYPAIGLFSCNESYLFCDSRRKKCVCVCVLTTGPRRPSLSLKPVETGAQHSSLHSRKWPQARRHEFDIYADRGAPSTAEVSVSAPKSQPGVRHCFRKC